MKLKFVFLIIILLFCFLFSNKIVISSYDSIENVKVNDSSFDFFNNGLYSNFSCDITIDEAELIKQKFLDLELNSSGAEKIINQLKILKSFKFFSSNISYNFIIELIGFVNHTGFIETCFNETALFFGPTIISHFTINDCVSAILPLRKPLFYFSIISGENISGVGGFLPYYFGKVKNSIYLTCVSYFYKKSYDNKFSIFREFMIPCMGFSISFLNNSNSNNPVLFEYNLDFCSFAIIRGNYFL